MRSDDEKRQHEQMVDLAMRARRSYQTDPEFHAIVTVIVQEEYAVLRAERDAAVARAETAERERDAYKRGKAENDERFMFERDEARAALADSVAREQQLREQIEAALRENEHADTCGSMLSPDAGYPCSCWRAALAAVPSPAVTPEPSTLDRMMWHCIEPDCEWGWSQIIAWINRNGGKARYKVNGQLFDTPETRNITTPLIAIRTPTGWDCYVAPGDTVVVGDDWFDPAGLASICLGIRSFSVERAVTPEPRPGPVLRDVPRLPATAALDHCGTCHRPLPHNEVESHACRAVPVETTEDR